MYYVSLFSKIINIIESVKLYKRIVKIVCPKKFELKGKLFFYLFLFLKKLLFFIW